GGGGNSAGNAPGPGAAAQPLRALAREASRPLTRFHALWALEAIGSLAAGDVLRALDDAEPGVREAAARLAERFLGPAGASGLPRLLERLCALAADPSPRVRRQAALALGGVPAADEADEAGRAAVLGALAGIARRDCGDEWTRAAILSGAPERAAPLLGALLLDGTLLRDGAPAPPAGPAPPPGLEALASALAAVAGARGEPRDAALVLEAAGAAGVRGAGALAGAALTGLCEGLRRAGKRLPDLLASPPAGLEGAVKAVAPLFEKTAAEATDASLPEALRAERVRLLSCAAFSLVSERLAALLDPREPQGVQLAAVRALAAYADLAVGRTIASRWPALSPPVRREALEALFQRGERLEAVLDALEEGAMAAADFEPSRRERLLKHPDAALRGRAARLLEESVPADRKAVIEARRGALALKGDAGRGGEVFKRVCATCHKLGEVGNLVAPDFRAVRDRTPEALLEQVLDPNREVAPQFVAYTVQTVDGRVLTGILTAETETSLTLRRAEGVEEAVLRSEVLRLESTGVSLMPEGLERDLTDQDVADVIEAIRAEG
ncbi:MAG: c-type cytochrome, partial [Planctomycetes bacterium]|nr:c-type cytochrome [Planctomycetota bacterium]